MRRALLAVSAAAMIGVTACGSDNDSTDATANSVDAGARPVGIVPAPAELSGTAITDSATLQAAMLTVGDLPGGYAPLPDPVRDLGLDPAPEYDAPDRSSTDPKECADVLAPVSQQAPGATASAEVRYSGPNFSSIDEDAASYADSGASTAFEAVQSAFAQCSTYSGTDADAVAVDYRLGGREQGAVGDASASIRLETTSEGFALVSDAVIAVVDHTVVQFVVTSQDGVDPASFTALAQTAVDRIKGVDRGV